MDFSLLAVVWSSCCCRRSAPSARSRRAVRHAGCSSGRCRRCTRPSSPSWPWSSTSPTGWPGAATRRGSLFDGLLPFLLIVGPVLVLVLLEPDLGTIGVLDADRLHDVLRRRRQPVAAGRCWSRWASARRGLYRHAQQLPDGPRPGLPGSVGRPAGHRLPHGAGAAGAGHGRASWASAWARAANPARCTCRHAQNDFVFAVVGQELGFIGGVVVIGLYLLLRLPRHPHRAAPRRTRSARCSPSASPPG